MKKVRVGIIGFGTVGAGVVECIQKNGALIGKRTGLTPVITRIADLDLESDRGVQVPEKILTTDANEVIEAKDVDVVVELIGGTTTAKTFILKALERGKPVVTANKALLAEHGKEIFDAAKASRADVYYEASVAGGIPIIKAIREGLIGNKLIEMVGILNGTCNYILTRMEQESATFEDILRDAQQAGYAEADPGLDVDGIDTAHKATILASLAYGEWFGTDQLYVEGVRGISLQDIQNAAALGYRIKLLAIIKQKDEEVQMRVHPALVSRSALLGNVTGVHNAVWVKGDVVNETMYYGRGAGREATASAVVADIVDVGLNLKFGSHRRVPAFKEHEGYARMVPMSEVKVRYYLRLQIQDHPGVLHAISGVLADANISIASVNQQEVNRKVVPLIILTYKAKEGDVQKAMAELCKIDDVVEKPVFIRIEDFD